MNKPTIRKSRQGSLALTIGALLIPLSAWIGVARAEDSEQPADTLPLGRTVYAYPTGDPRTSILLIEHLMPHETRVGREFEYVVKLSNVTRADLKNLTLTMRFPADVEVRGVDVPPTRRGDGGGTWELDVLRAESAASLRFRIAARQVGQVMACATISMQTENCAGARVVEPNLKLVKTAPREVMLCDPIPIHFVVTNPGSGVTTNVQIRDQLPEGWLTEDGKTGFVLSAGDLAPGQAREMTVQVKAQRTGDFTNTAVATCAEELTSQASAATRVVRPVLQVTKSAPEVRFIGRPVKFDIVVANTGDGIARDTMLVDQLPSGLTFTEASDNGRFSGGTVTWALGNLSPGERRAVSVSATAREAGNFKNTAVARAYCAEAGAESQMSAKGIPAILLEVIDVDDPVEVGKTTTYEINVLNQGSADGTNIVISCELPAEEEFVTADGPTKGTASIRKCVFDPLPRLAPRASVKYRIQVRGVKEGDARFKVTMSSAELDRDKLVEETESTRIY
ncbi:MAG: hypothetical protein U1D55_02865 [Phycisphaerae bacterium]